MDALEDEELVSEYFSCLGFPNKTEHDYRLGIENLSAHLAKSGTGLAEASGEDIQSWVDRMELRGMKVASRRMYLSAARGFYRWLSKEMGMPNPTDGVSVFPESEKAAQMPALNPRKAKVALSKSRKRAENSLEGMREYAVLRLALVCSLRNGEISAADVDDIVVDNGISCIATRRAGRRSDVVPLDRETELAVRSYIAERTAADGEHAIFTSSSKRNWGKRISLRSVNMILNGALECVGETSGSVNMLKTAMGLALAGGATENEVREFARRRSFDAVARAASDSDAEGVVAEKVSTALGEIALGRTTVSELRAALVNLPDDAVLLGSVDASGRFFVAPEG